MSVSAEQSISFYDSSKGIKSWILSTDHKRIGLLYFYAIATFFLVAVGLGILMRLELIAPGKTLMEAKTYNQVFTLHGVIMIFLFIIPVVPAIFGNFFRSILSIPLAILFNVAVGSFLTGFGVTGVNDVLQKWAAIVSKTASDCVAGIIEGQGAAETKVSPRDTASCTASSTSGWAWPSTSGPQEPT